MYAKLLQQVHGKACGISIAALPAGRELTIEGLASPYLRTTNCHL